MRCCRERSAAFTRSRCASTADTLDSHGVLDFSETLAQALSLLAQMDEFARSRYRLEGRYHHVLLDEFQDTSRAQWTLVALLIRSWGEGSGIAESAPLVPSIFLVGDRKQSIYGFRDADVAVMDEAGDFVDGLRPDHDSRRAISKSFRAVPQLLAFANDVFADIEKDETRRDAFRFGEQDTFPGGAAGSCRPTRSGSLPRRGVADHADAVAAEIRRLLDSQTARPRPGDAASRVRSPRATSASCFARKTAIRISRRRSSAASIPSYVYKGLGFFEADEIKDVLALLRYLAAPESNLRAAAFLRSRFVRLSDPALQALAPESCAVRCRRAPSSSLRSTPRIASCSSARGRASPDGSGSSIDCRRRKCSSWCSTRPHTCSRRAARARARREKT